jgi:hypothetical protein
MNLGSGIGKKPILNPGFRGQKGAGSWIRIRNTGIFNPSVADPESQSCIQIFSIPNPNFFYPESEFFAISVQHRLS